MTAPDANPAQQPKPAPLPRLQLGPEPGSEAGEGGEAGEVGEAELEREQAGEAGEAGKAGDEEDVEIAGVEDVLFEGMEAED